jgi:hypothetical protein
VIAGVIGFSLGAGVGAGAGQLVNSLVKSLPQYPAGPSSGSEVIEIEHDAQLAVPFQSRGRPKENSNPTR